MVNKNIFTNIPTAASSILLSFDLIRGQSENVPRSKVKQDIIKLGVLDDTQLLDCSYLTTINHKVESNL